MAQQIFKKGDKVYWAPYYGLAGASSEPHWRVYARVTDVLSFNVETNEQELEIYTGSDLWNRRNEDGDAPEARPRFKRVSSFSCVAYDADAIQREFEMRRRGFGPRL